jgi:hypothetical protein
MNQHSIAIQTILNSASSGLSFQPKYIACISGIPENICQSHCELLAKAGQIRRVLKDFEVWFKEKETLFEK